MRKNILLLLLTLFSFSAIHAEKSWEINGIKCNLSDDGTFTISGTGDMPNYNSPADVPWYNDRKQIKKVVIEDGVTNIVAYAFDGCSNLTSIEIPNSVTSIGECTFYGCGNLTSVTIPNSVTRIEDEAFGGCESLTSVEIPNSVTSIGEKAFSSCETLTSIEIPNSVTSIGDEAFFGCSVLTSITVEKGNTKYDSRDNCNAIIETSSNKLIRGCKNTVIPTSVTSIGDYAFSHCASLPSIEIPNSVTSIEKYAFLGCEALTSVEIPNSVTRIEYGAFWNCPYLTSITFKGNTPPEFEKDVFKYVYKSFTVYVPANSIEAYKGAFEGSGVSNIQANPKQVFS